MTAHRRGNRERGTAALEYIGMLPIILFAALIALQMGVVAWTVVATGQAARDAARAASLGRSPQAAANGALPSLLTASSVSGGPVAQGQRYTVEVPIPSVFKVVGFGSVSRTSTMPDIR